MPELLPRSLPVYLQRRECEAGPAALTMKAVAARLGPYTAMALYRYVYNKDGLVDLMLDAATAEIPRPAQPGPDWRADLLGLAAQTRLMIKRHPWYATLIHTRPPVGPHMMQRLEFMLRVLTAQGASTAAAMTYAALIDRHIFGSGLQEAEEAQISTAERREMVAMPQPPPVAQELEMRIQAEIPVWR